MSGEPGDRGRLARAVADAVLAVPGVSRLTEGSAIRAVTHLAGGTVAGVVLTPGQVAVHIAVDRTPLRPVADAVRDAVRASLAAALRQSEDIPEVTVTVDDLDVDFSALGPPPGATETAAAAERARRWRASVGARSGGAQSGGGPA